MRRLVAGGRLASPGPLRPYARTHVAVVGLASDRQRLGLPFPGSPRAKRSSGRVGHEGRVVFPSVRPPLSRSRSHVRAPGSPGRSCREASSDGGHPAGSGAEHDVRRGPSDVGFGSVRFGSVGLRSLVRPSGLVRYSQRQRHVGCLAPERPRTQVYCQQ